MIQIIDNFSYQGPKPNFVRDWYKDRAAMKLVVDSQMDDGHISYCSETGLHYEYKYTNSEDVVLGKWREYKPVDSVLSSTSENSIQNKVVAAQISDLLEKYEELKTAIEEVDVEMDSVLSDESERGVQNKVLKAKFDSIGVQIAGLVNNVNACVKTADVQTSVNNSTNPVSSKAVKTVTDELTSNISDINEQIDNIIKYHLTDAEIEAIYKETRGAVVDDLGKTRFDEVYDWYKSILAGKEDAPEGGIDYSTVEKRVEDLEDNLSQVKMTATNAFVTSQGLREWYDSFPEDDNQTWGIMNRKPEIVAGEDEEVLVATSANAASLALESLQRGMLVVDGADEGMIDEMRVILGDQIFNDLAAKSIQTMELKPQLTLEEQIEQAKEAYINSKQQEVTSPKILPSIENPDNKVAL